MLRGLKGMELAPTSAITAERVHKLPHGSHTPSIQLAAASYESYRSVDGRKQIQGRSSRT